MTFFSSFPKTEINLFNDGQLYEIINSFRYVKLPNKFKNNFVSYTKYTVIDGERPDIVSQKLYGTPDYYWTFFIVNDFLRGSYNNWMMSTDKLQEYVKIYLSDTVLVTRPVQVLDADGLLLRIDNSVVGNFDLDNKELITGSVSGATGNVVDVDQSLQQIRVTNTNGFFRKFENIVGSNTGDIISIFETYERMANAPCEFIDSNGDIQDNQLFFQGGISNTNLEPVTYYQKLQEVNESRSVINVINPSIITDFVKQFRSIVS